MRAQSPMTRQLGQTGPVVSALGLGGWAIGGPFASGPGCAYPTGQPLGWGTVDDAESTRAVHAALAGGVTFFDTADAYGAGHGEHVLGAALAGKRAGVVLATKFGNTYDEDRRELTGTDVSPAYMRSACEASLRRLRTDWIDLYQLHLGDLPVAEAAEVADALDGLRDAGLIRSYAWSTDDPVRAAAFAGRAGAVAVQHDLNVFADAPELLAVCRAHGLASINRCPLAMGFLSGKFSAASRLSADDIRGRPPPWLPYFEAGGQASPEWLARLADLREILTSGSRSLVQGALAWIWARDGRTIPIPGFRTEAQVLENVGAMEFGPLASDQMGEIERLLGRSVAQRAAPSSAG